MQELPQRLFVGVKLLEGLAFNAGNNRRNEPLRLAHLDHGDDRTVLLEDGEGSARVKGVRHGALHRFVVERQRCLTPAARPIAS
jgi:hypothetical protein